MMVLTWMIWLIAKISATTHPICYAITGGRIHACLQSKRKKIWNVLVEIIGPQLAATSLLLILASKGFPLASREASPCTAKSCITVIKRVQIMGKVTQSTGIMHSRPQWCVCPTWHAQHEFIPLRTELTRSTWCDKARQTNWYVLPFSQRKEAEFDTSHTC